MITLGIIIGVVLVLLVAGFMRHQHKLQLRAHLMQEAIRNRDFTFRLSTKGLPPGEKALQETLNQLGETIRQQMSRNEVESWERLTRVLTHEIMNSTAPITSISQSLLNRPDVKGTPLENGIKAICETYHHLRDFVTNYRKMSELENPVLAEVNLSILTDELARAYQELSWNKQMPDNLMGYADAGMLRHILMNLAKNAAEAGAKRVTVKAGNGNLYIGNDGLPIPAENRKSVFVPFFTTKRNGYGIGLALSRKMMILQGGSLELAEKNLPDCHVTFILSLPQRN